jgi:L-aspartate oxidase
MSAENNIPEHIDVLVLGSGLAGCATAWAAAEKGAEVAIVTRAHQPEESNSFWAQGGIVFRGHNDSPELLARDILEAGAHLGDPAAVGVLAREGPELVQSVLIDQLGVEFDRDPTNPAEFDLTREGAHSCPRILHVKDQTGTAIERAFFARVSNHPRIRLLRGFTAIDLLTLPHHSEEPLDVYRAPQCFGVYALDQSTAEIVPLRAAQTVLATGGIGRLYLHTTNPAGARGDGLALAHRAGARSINLQYVQFHPTALFHPSGTFLISEALRGEGARVVDSVGHEFLSAASGGALAPPDVVARGIYQHMLEKGEPCAWLDITHKPAEWIRERFPGVHAHCASLGIDITREPIPIVPAAHYSCGGVAVDAWGQTSLPGLRAVGEVACTGVHGANRLGSTSLLECLVWGVRAGRQSAEQSAASPAYFPRISPWRYERESADPALIAQDWLTIRHTMWNYVGLIRTAKRLERAREILQELHLEISQFYRRAALDDAIIGLRNAVEASILIVRGATECRASRGCHFRVD